MKIHNSRAIGLINNSGAMNWSRDFAGELGDGAFNRDGTTAGDGDLS
jgi:hypothetical protein